MEKRSALVRRLVRAGFVLARHGKKHDIYANALTGRRVTIARHADDIARGTYLAILRDAGLVDEG